MSANLIILFDLNKKSFSIIYFSHLVQIFLTMAVVVFNFIIGVIYIKLLYPLATIILWRLLSIYVAWEGSDHRASR